jgi:hypothetical protein
MTAYREAITIIAPAEVAINAAKIARRAVEGTGRTDPERMAVLREYAELLVALQRLQLSGVAGAAPSASWAAPDSTSGGLSDGRVDGSGDAPPDATAGSPPDPNGTSTPEQEEAPGPARSGAEGHQQPDAGTPPPDVTTPPGKAAVTPPGRRPPGGLNGMAGSGAKGARSGRGSPRDSHGPAAGQPTSASSAVTLWSFKKGLTLAQVLVHLKHEHPDDFKDVLSTEDLYTMDPEQAARAVAYLKAGFGVLTDDEEQRAYEERLVEP